MKAVIYARVSTTDQAKEGTSITTQRHTCRAHIEQQGRTLIDEYVDEGVSGATERRPGLAPTGGTGDRSVHDSRG